MAKMLYSLKVLKVCLMCLLAWCVEMQVSAQKTCVIASAEDHVPVREALIHTNNNHWARTDYRGYFTMKYQFDSATVSRAGFVKTTIYLKNLPDTVFLLPESKEIGTVEVWGKQQNVQRMGEQATQEAVEATKLTPKPLARFDLANMMDVRGRRDYRHLKKAKKVMSDYDNDGKDPIEQAYEKAVGDKAVLKKPESMKREKDEDKSK